MVVRTRKAQYFDEKNERAPLGVGNCFMGRMLEG